MQFKDNSGSLELKPEAGPNITNSSHTNPKSSTPYHTLLNHMFDVSHILPLTSGNHQDAATIASEVAAAAVVQASEEFYCMCKPKIIYFKGGYSTDTELVFRYWHADIFTHI